MRYFLDTVDETNCIVSENKRGQWETLVKEWHAQEDELNDQPRHFAAFLKDREVTYAMTIGQLRSVSFTGPQEGDTPIHF